MRNTIIVIGVILVLGLFIVFPMIGSYNKLVKLDQEVKSSWAQVENVYQRRLNLIPNLVSTVKGEANFEKSTLVEVQNARSKATQVTIDPTNMTEQNMAQFQAAQGQVSSALGRLMVSVENYPQLKANQAFRDLSSQLEGSENRITTEIRRFNEVTTGYNNKVLSFPSNIMAGWFGFKEKPYFKADEGAAKVPTVEF
jgi:LemA protein